MANKEQDKLLIDGFLENAPSQPEKPEPIIQEEHQKQVEEFYENEGDPVKEFLSEAIHQQINDARTSLGKTDSIAILTDALLYVDLIAQMKRENNEILYDILDLSPEHRNALADLLYERDTIYSTIEEAKESIKKEWLNEANSYADEQRQIAFDRYVQEHPDDTPERLAAFEEKEKIELDALHKKVYDTTIQSLIEILEQNIVNGHEIAASNALLKVILARKFIREMDKKQEELEKQTHVEDTIQPTEEIDLDAIIDEGYQDEELNESEQNEEVEDEQFETEDEEVDDGDFDLTVTDEDIYSHDFEDEDSDNDEDSDTDDIELEFGNSFTNEDEEDDSDATSEDEEDDEDDFAGILEEDEESEEDEQDPVIPSDKELEDVDLFADLNVDEKQSEETSQNQTNEENDGLIDNTDFDNDEFYENQAKKLEKENEEKLAKMNQVKENIEENVEEKVENDQSHKVINKETLNETLNKPPKKKGKVLLTVIGCIVAFILLAALCAYLLSQFVFTQQQTKPVKEETAIETQVVTEKHGFAVGDVLSVSANGKQQVITIESFNEQGALAKSETNEVFLLTNQQLQNYQATHSPADTQNQEDANSDNSDQQGE